MSASQRKNYFIAKDMQSKFAGTILLLTLLVAVITASNIYVLGCFFVEKNSVFQKGPNAGYEIERSSVRIGSGESVSA